MYVMQSCICLDIISYMVYTEYEGGDDMKRLMILIDAELLRAFKHRCVDEDRSMSKVISELIRKYLKEKNNG